MRRIKRIIGFLAAALISAVLLFAALPAPAHAVGYITGVEITGSGRMIWDVYPGAVDHWLGINGGFTPIENGEYISKRFDEAGTYELELDAYTENRETLLAMWKGTVEFDGSEVTLTWSEPDPGIPTPEPTEAPTEAPANETTAEPANETQPPFEADTPLPAQPSFEPDLPQQSVTSVLILAGYIVLGLLLFVAAAVIIVLVILLVRKKKK